MSLSPTSSLVRPTLLAAADHRSSVNLNGAWRTIVDPYATGLYTFHGELRTDGYFMNGKQAPGGEYEGPIWYQRDFSYQPKPGTRVFFHVGAANYRSYLWVNEQMVCEHEGGFTPFDCEVTGMLKEGANFVIMVVDNTRLADGIPTLQTDWWNYGGLTRDVSLVEVPEQFIDEFDLHLKRGSRTEIEGWVHVEGAATGARTTVSIPELDVTAEAPVGSDGRATFHFEAGKLEPWSPENPRLYQVRIHAGQDDLEDVMGFRTVEVSGAQILLNGSPVFLRGVCIHAEGALPLRARVQ
jgi:beta-glucuronidase